MSGYIAVENVSSPGIPMALQRPLLLAEQEQGDSYRLTLTFHIIVSSSDNPTQQEQRGNISHIWRQRCAEMIGQVHKTKKKKRPG